MANDFRTTIDSSDILQGKDYVQGIALRPTGKICVELRGFADVGEVTDCNIGQRFESGFLDRLETYRFADLGDCSLGYCSMKLIAIARSFHGVLSSAENLLLRRR